MKVGFVFALISCISSVLAVPGHGFVGYGISIYPLACASGCQDTVSTYVYCSPDEISTDDDMGMSMIVKTNNIVNNMDMDGMDSTSSSDNSTTRADSSNATEATTSPTDACLASYVPYLQTMAYCIQTHCKNSTETQITSWWYNHFFGNGADDPVPALSYSVALYTLTTAPNKTLDSNDPMTEAVIVDEETYIANFNADNNFEKAEKFHSSYGLAILFTCSLIPVVVSLLRFIVSEKYLRYLTSRFVDAPFMDRFYLNCGTRGEVCLALYFAAVNIAACFADIHSIQPNSWWTRRAEATTYIANRAGMISFANVPLIILFSSRNNILLWVTNWNYSTFMTMHKCAAFWSTIEACLHSAMYLQIYLGKGTHATESRKPYWVMGIVATLAMSIGIVHSLQAVRNAAYEIFVLSHRLLAILTLIGCWYHIILRFSHKWGYETWLYMGMAIWGFEHLMRYARIIANGFRYAYITPLDQDYIRVDIPGLSSSHYVYLYFLPETFSDLKRFRPWESHPFSVLSSNTPLKGEMYHMSEDASSLENRAKSFDLLEQNSNQTAESSGESDCKLHSKKDEAREKLLPSSRRINSTFIVKVRRGLTHSLLSKAGQIPIAVLVEAGYGSYWSNNVLSEIKLQSAEYPNMLFIAGGVGITPLIQTMLDTAYSSSRLGRVDLYWSCRSTALVCEVESVLRDYHESIGVASTWGNTNAFVSTESRFHLPDIISQKSLDIQGTRVIVCGPDSMIREARKLTSALARANLPVKFVSENFEW